MIGEKGKFILLEQTYVRKDAIETISLYVNKNGNSEPRFYVSCATRQMLFTKDFESEQAQLNYANELIAVLNERNIT